MSAAQTDEMMLPIFTKDTDGSAMKRHVSGLVLPCGSCYGFSRTSSFEPSTFADIQFVQPRRNYAIVEYKPTGELEFDIRVEKEQGGGVTVS
jgi:hypothetical protein